MLSCAVHWKGRRPWEEAASALLHRTHSQKLGERRRLCSTEFASGGMQHIADDTKIAANEQIAENVYV